MSNRNATSVSGNYNTSNGNGDNETAALPSSCISLQDDATAPQPSEDGSMVQNNSTHMSGITPSPSNVSLESRCSVLRKRCCDHFDSWLDIVCVCVTRCGRLPLLFTILQLPSHTTSIKPVVQFSTINKYFHCIILLFDWHL